MREFLLKASRAVTADFQLNDIAGAGRMDIVCRCVTAALWLSDQLRKETIFHAVLEGNPMPSKILTFDPVTMKRVYPDERNIASHIKMALKGEKQNGITIESKSFGEFLKGNKKQIVYLDSEGKDIRECEFEEDVLFVLGDNKGLNEDEKIFLDELGALKMSVGKNIYLASSTITIVHNELDRRL